VAEAANGVRSVAVFDTPEAGKPNKTLANPQDSGAPLVFVVEEEQPNWLKVELPVRPNGSTGWIKSADVRLSQHDWRIVVELAAHRITAYQGNAQFLQEPVGVGTGKTPTPGGRYYIKELLRPPDPRSVYGVYAYGLSGFSNVLTTFAGGPGVIGIHGTNDPSSLGKDVSAGCIRMSNEGITKLAANLPLGTPVEIRP
jgi:lipoprotein-anchoring transpeptidase ErfK/SrfK